MKKCNMAEVVFIFSYITWQIGYMICIDSTFSIYFNNIIFQAVRIMIYILLIFKIIAYDNLPKKRIPLIFLVSLLFILSSFMTGNFYLFDLLLFIIAYKGVNTERFFKISLFVNVTIFLAIVLSAKVGIIDNLIFSRGYGSDVFRESLGYNYCTYAQIHFLTIVLLYFYVRKKKITILELGIMIFISYYIWQQTDARTGFYCIIIMVVLMIIYKYFEKIYYNKFFKIFIIISPIVFSVVCIALAMNYDVRNEFLYELNDILSGRLYLSNLAWKNDGFTLFGQKVEWIGVGQQTSENANKLTWFVDCSYLRMFFNEGIILGTIVLLGLAFVLKDSFDKKNTIIIIVLFVYLIHGLIEPQMLRFAYSPFVVLLSWFLYGKENYEYENCSSYCYI